MNKIKNYYLFYSSCILKVESNQFLRKNTELKFFIYRKWAYVGHIGNMVRHEFDHQKKYQDLFFIKGNFG